MVRLGPIVWSLLKFSVTVAMKALVFEGKPGTCFGTIRRAWYTFADHVVGTMEFGMIWMLTDAFVFMLRHGLNMYSSHSANIFEYPTIAIC